MIMFLLEARNLSKSFGNVHVFDKLNINIGKSEAVCLLGLSGSGKTTLMSILSGLRRPDTGSVIIDGINLYSQHEVELSELVGMIFQDFMLLEDYTSIENIIVARWHLRQNIDDIVKHILPILNDVGITEHINKFPGQLSSGLKQRVALARALVNNPKVIFADEPTASLDSENSITLMKTLLATRNTRRSVLFSTHDLEIAKFADKIYILRNNNIELIDKKILLETNKLLDLYNV